ncbi:MAG: hypothetical protein UU64_C0024G0009 [candidate division WWE3 bacterium GW2011_GWF2_41_45]|uniref:Uncharacterized protein n=1 Tax=candidate division WWE3 bacterium GW2011_GWC2_41_23 TaxID=1619123 RepID=A0A0G0VM85_UNCKA|nr:MAG: hypothetical protein UU55_C0018G0004 [candidate division WWE3 bacterium GW2011_GWC2_41_23]KKS08601.1 MAG: hypothetical protein UU64_C0024G0009 [candidate division WWE3 bacterium GW2011_GWF2_41_45]HCT30307.1 hypothetical protein [Bacteroidales bacterium]
MNCTSTVLEISKWLGGVVVSSGFVYWIIQRLFENKFQKGIEKYKNELSIELEKSKVTFNNLHSKRINIISNLYKKLVAVNNSLASMTKPLQLAGEPAKEEKLKTAIDDYNNFLHYFDDHRIYFSEPVAKKIDDIVDSFRGVCLDYDCYYPAYKQSLDASDGANAKDYHAELVKAWNKVKNDIPTIRLELESELRKIIGV